LIRRRRLALVALLVVVGIFGVASTRTQVKNDLSAFFVTDDPALVGYREFIDRFGTDEVVVVAVVDDETPVGDAARHAELLALQARLQVIPHIDVVRSLADVEVVVAGEDSGEDSGDDNGDGDGSRNPARVARVARVGAGPAAINVDDALRDARARHSPTETLASADDRAQLVWIWLNTAGTTDAGRSAAVAAIFDAVEPLRATRGVHVAGGGVVWEGINALTVRDGAIFISLAAMVLFVGVIIVTRRVLWALVATAAVSCANTVVFGAMAMAGIPINAITVCLPSLVMALGVLDLVHLIGAVDRLRLRRDPPSHTDLQHADDDVVFVDGVDDDAVVDAIVDVIAPGAINIATTAVGLLALLSATSAVTQQLGAGAALGVVVAWVSCVVWTAVALPRALAQRPRRGGRAQKKSWPTDLNGRLATVAMTHRGGVAVVTVVALVASALGMVRLRADTDTVGFLGPAHPARVDLGVVQSLAGPFVPMEFDVELGGEDGGVLSAAVVNGLALAQTRLAHSESPLPVGRARSIVDVLREARLALLGTATDIPFSDDDVVATVSFIEATTPMLFDGLRTTDGRHLRLTVPVTVGSASALVAAADHAGVVVRDALVDEGVSDGGGDRNDVFVRDVVDVRLTGYLPLYARIVQSLVHDQVVSFGLAFVMVFVIVGAFLRRPRFVLLAAIPNLVPIAGVLGFMGVAGIPLDVATITIAATILGVVVDDTVHTLHRLRHALPASGATSDQVEAAVVAAARAAGRANLRGNLLLAASFSVLCAASARSLVLVGGLSCLAVLLALTADLFVLPALARALLPAPSSSSSSRSSSPMMGWPGRMRVFVAERFPLVPSLVGAALLSLSAELLGRALHATPAALRPDGQSVALAVVVFCFFFIVRGVDELSDRDDDRLAHPERPLSRGAVSVADVVAAVAVAAIIAVVAGAVVAGVEGAGVVGAVVVVTVVVQTDILFKMKRTPLHPTVQLVVHQLMVPLWVATVLALRLLHDDGVVNVMSLLRAWPAMALALVLSLLFELGRKVHHPLDENPNDPSWSSVWGLRRACGVIIVAVATLTVAVVWIALATTMPWWVLVVPGITALVVVGSCIWMLAARRRGAGRFVALSTALASLWTYLPLVAGVVWTHG
jgi:predicted RND superfamily exporter protein